MNTTTIITSSPIPIIIAILIGFIVLEIACSCFTQPRGQRRDAIIEIVGSSLLMLVTLPLVTFLANLLLEHFAPQLKNSLVGLHWLLGLGLFLALDDMTQYWWHRLSHKVPFLYSLHRAHHSAPYMSIRIVYRNNSFYYLLMPGLWFSGVLLYMGLGQVYFGYLIVKMLVIFGAHSSVPWDEKLYRIAVLRPLMWVLERTISTPATHSAHHGLNADDGVTNYKGNFGNLLFFWDVLFGSAKITRRRPEHYGIEDMKPVSWQEELFWPLARGKRVQTQRSSNQELAK